MRDSDAAAQAAWERRSPEAAQHERRPENWRPQVMMYGSVDSRLRNKPKEGEGSKQGKAVNDQLSLDLGRKDERTNAPFLALTLRRWTGVCFAMSGVGLLRRASGG
jgi:hypothetical protein